MTKFRPCIDLHNGKVKQIVGSSLRDDSEGPTVNFESNFSAAYYAERYREDKLKGGHLIKLGPGNDEAAREALAAYPGGLQIGGGISADNAAEWLEAGAAKVIVTSWLFDDAGRFQSGRLDTLVDRIGSENLVIDLSCRASGDGWRVAMNRWQTLTDLTITEANLRDLEASCAEFLIHAADVEGMSQGIDETLVEVLGRSCTIPVTYAGGARCLEDLRRVDRLSRGRVDLTIGSALDLFGGTGVTYQDCLRWNRRGGKG